MTITVPTHYQRFSGIPFSKGLRKKEPKGVLVLGAGTMGRLIGKRVAQSGRKIVFEDKDQRAITSAQDFIRTRLQRDANRGTISKALWPKVKDDGIITSGITLNENLPVVISAFEAKEFLKTQCPSNDVTGLLSSGELDVIEAGPEITPFKRIAHGFHSKLLQANRNPNEVIIATNTSGKLVGEIDEIVLDRTRHALFHFLFPEEVNNVLVEVGYGPETSDKTVLQLVNLAMEMGIKPVICFKDSKGAIGNRYLTGFLIQEARMYDTGLGSIEEIDQILHEMLYGELLELKTPRAKKDFKSAPGLSVLKDESELYEQIAKCKNTNKKKILVLELRRRLTQKVLYAGILQDFEALGALYKPSPFILSVEKLAKEQLGKVNKYIEAVDKNLDKIFEPLEMTPYEFPEPALVKDSEQRTEDRQLIHDGLLKTYRDITEDLFNKGLATKHDIQTICTDGYKWISPFKITGGLTANEEEICGVQTYIQGNIGIINFSRTSVQHSDLEQNLLNPAMLRGVLSSIKNLENNEDIHSIIIRSQGGDVFSAGIDLEYLNKEIKWDQRKYDEYMELYESILDRIENCKKPVTSIIDGAVAGAGVGIALASDYRIMADTSFIQFPEVAVGIVPPNGVLKRLPAVIGKDLAIRLITRPKLALTLLGKEYGFQFYRLYGNAAEEVGFADLCVERHNLIKITAALTEGKIKSIDIYSKSPRKKNYAKKDYPDHMGRFLNLPFWFSPRLLTRRPAQIAREAILVSNDDEKFKAVVNHGANIVSVYSGKQVTEAYINRLILAAKGKWTDLVRSFLPFNSH